MSSPSNTNELEVAVLLETPTMSIRDMRCSGACGHKSPSECASATYLVFPYRGLFARHVGSRQTLAEANQLMFFNQQEEYAISHPVGGGDSCLSVGIDPALLQELAPREQLEHGPAPRFRVARRSIESRSLALVALLKNGLANGTLEPMQAESLALSLIRRSLGARTPQARAGTYGKQKLVERTKMLLAANPGRRWTLAEMAADVGVSPVYLTQIFTRVEGISLYRYQLRLRLARAVDLLGRQPDLSRLALDLGFSSHSHFSTTFHRYFGRSPGDLRRAFEKVSSDRLKF